MKCWVCEDIADSPVDVACKERTWPDMGSGGCKSPATLEAATPDFDDDGFFARVAPLLRTVFEGTVGPGTFLILMFSSGAGDGWIVESAGVDRFLGILNPLSFAKVPGRRSD
jgi:hypothetical protein